MPLSIYNDKRGVNFLKNINNLIKDEKTLFVVNHSGGKDSQAMFLYVSSLIPKERIYVIHASLGEIEWPGTIEHIKNTIGEHDFKVVSHAKGETLLTLAEKRGKFPSPSQRSCTSQLKTGPIDKEIRHELKRRGLLKVVSCMGMRAQESSARAKQPVFKLDENNSKAGRSWYRWLPIHAWAKNEVFEYIKFFNQKPHWAYEKGMSRLSCCFCIMSSKNDLKTAAKLRPDLLEKYDKLEKKLDQTLMMPSKKHGKKFLKDIVDD